MPDTQDFLFGTSSDVVGGEAARSEVRLLAWNVQSPSLQRTRRQLEWIYETRCNVIILTEVRTGDASAYLVKDLGSNGFDVHIAEVRDGHKYANVIATMGFSVRPVRLTFTSPRLTCLRLTTHLGQLDVIALYSLTNGMTAESSRNRAAFQQEVLTALSARIAAEPRIPVVMAGDFNVLEPGHLPPSHLFEEHDYAFYRALADLTLCDAYRVAQPAGRDVSWCGPQGGQRLDHAFLTSALAGSLSECRYDHDPRMGRLSDHSALTLTLGGNLAAVPLRANELASENRSRLATQSYDSTNRQASTMPVDKDHR